MNQSTSDMIAIADSSAFASGPRRTASAAPRRRRYAAVLPGFGTSLAITSLVVLALVVFPLAVLVLRAASLGPAGFLDAGFQKLIGPLLDTVAGQGYGPWFIAMACLHPLALIFLWIGGIARPAMPKVQP